jgi:hypothetical protein
MLGAVETRRTTLEEDELRGGGMSIAALGNCSRIEREAIAKVPNHQCTKALYT